ncbi:MAG: carbohydrate ABC transporter permease [Lachnospiraceae bacterium]|nr:carbohydrate ABC transporter permease [Lachnospiraceae bacterium]
MTRIEKQALKKRKNFGEGGMVEGNSVGGVIADVIIVIILTIVAFAAVVPLWHTLMSSISDGRTLFRTEGLVALPVGKATLDGYALTLKDSSILRAYGNTLIYVIGSTAFGFVLNVIGGYVLSRKFKLRSTLMMLITLTMLFSGGTIPLYMVVRRLGMVGTRWALMLPHCTNGAFMVMMVKAFDSVPEATVEAARIDGAGHLRIMFQIMLPQCFSFALVTMVNTAIIAWNAWFSASIYVPTDKTRWPLQLWIRDLVASNQDFLNWTNPDYSRYLISYCVIIISTLPILMLFPLFIKRLEKGMARGGVKE